MSPQEFKYWFDSKHADVCEINSEGSSGGMVYSGMLEMFNRLEDLHDAKYEYYVGDGDTKTFKHILESTPYIDLVVKKLECVIHVGKRMF